MKIVVLIGKSNTGKTSAIKELILELINNKRAKLYDVPGANKCKTFISPYKMGMLDTIMLENGDVFAKLKLGNKTIGISTAGDARWHIEHKLNLLSDCEYFVCASREYGSSYDYICELKQFSDYAVETVYKIGCIVCENDLTHNEVIDYFDKLAVEELKKCLEVY